MSQSFQIYRCRGCGSYAFGGPEEIVHLRNVCAREPERVVVERLTTVPIRRERLVAPASVKKAA